MFKINSRVKLKKDIKEGQVIQGITVTKETVEFAKKSCRITDIAVAEFGIVHYGLENNKGETFHWVSDKMLVGVK